MQHTVEPHILRGSSSKTGFDERNAAREVSLYAAINENTDELMCLSEPPSLSVPMPPQEDKSRDEDLPAPKRPRVRTKAPRKRELTRQEPKPGSGRGKSPMKQTGKRKFSQ